ncbi:MULTISPECIES: hemolysin III family protein [unclassified Apibacter]|uniref:PAQR family membrane homeostasis protein TrhA n=1 Tax=unclassified Apibacter TaxID=2630820 RepID=UPI00132418B5|nr:MULTISPECIES: hemolysin III family protein [unclassified Apibacter]MCX8676565.1 hemolysin III family protein [Apibacter sp. B3919]MXO24026.1 hemolysin III family protein [Apibacter sp. B3924]MXO26296.1 hemolysin III family protein [Apibacter sp. B3813]MXO28247.1 hemolysin III family protein [Apibacter sp. B3913]MXO30201.1 hemolysin III family protein [Apibacter sp. B3912]
MTQIARDKQEILNTISHGMGIVLGIVGLIFLLVKNNNSSIYSTLSIWTFGLSLIILYTSSTIYHFFVNENWKKKARVLDHMSIFLLIAGTYTPICLITLEKSSGWTLFTIVWTIAALGIIMKIFLTGKVDKLSLLLYLVMGWLLVFDIKNIANSMTSQALIFLVLGGILYTLGTIFYARDKMPYAHFIWHLFVLGGSASHYAMVYYII